MRLCALTGTNVIGDGINAAETAYKGSVTAYADATAKYTEYGTVSRQRQCMGGHGTPWRFGERLHRCLLR